MEDETKNIVKWVGVGAVALGTVAVYIGGGSEAYTTEIVGGVAVIIGIIMGIIKK